MALPSFLKRKTAAPTAPDDAGIVQRARTSARRRLIGAAVLLAIGVIAFPLLFETQPRPIPVDIPIEIPRKDGQPPLTAPAKPARVAAGAVADPAPRAVAEPAAAASVAGTPKPAADPSTPPSRAAVSAEVATAAPTAPEAPSAPARASTVKPAPAPASAAVAAAPKDARPAEATSKPSSAPATADAAGRYVVQVGAFAEATSAREVRLKVEKLGMKTYTQVVETAQGRRIRVRVGPFASQAEADKTLARLKAANLPGAVLTL